MKAKHVFRDALLVLLAGLALTLLVSHGIRRDLEEKSLDHLAALADEAALKVRQQLWAYGIALRGGAGFFNGSGAIDRQEWHAYVAALQLGENLPGVQGMGFVEWIPRAALPAHEARARADGLAGYRVHPAGEREHYAAIVYLEPFSERNRRAFGYDMHAEPVRRTALYQARDSGLATLSGKVRLLQEDGRDEQAGVLMYFPVYRAGLPVTTVAQRRAALLGWTYSPYRMGDLMAATFTDWRDRFGRTLFLAVYEGGHETAAARLFDNAPAAFAQDAGVLRQRRLVEFRGQRWLLVFSRRLAPASIGYAPVWGALAGGSVISLLLAGLVLALGRTRSNAQRMAEGMTADLRASQQRLQESEAHLRETEMRWKFALEGSDLGVWDWNVATGEVWFSPRWKEMLGYEVHEIAASVQEWERRIHPDDREAITRDLQPCLDGRVRLYFNEHRLLHRDGNYRWILDRGMVLTRDADGKPLRMLGTHADVTHTHEARDRVRRLDGLYAALSACNSAIVRCTSREEIYAEVCAAVVGFAGVKMAWVGRIDASTRRVLPVHASGTGTAYVEGIEISLDADEVHGRGPTGTAARENRTVWTPDFAQDPAVAPWQLRALPYGWVASAALPVRESGKPVAVFTIYVDDDRWFDEETRALLDEMASDLSYALDKFAAEAEAQVARHRLVESEQRFQAIVEQSPAVAFIFQEGGLAYANPSLRRRLGLAEDAGLPGLPGWVVAEDCARVEAVFRRLLAGETSGVELRFALRCAGGRVAEVDTHCRLGRYRGRTAVIGTGREVGDRQGAEVAAGAGKD